jgi:acyl carrier protein
MPDLLPQINAVFQEVFGDDELQVERHTTAADVEGWDSLQHVSLMIAIEARFGVRFTSAEVAELKDVGQLVDLVRSRLPGA